MGSKSHQLVRYIYNKSKREIGVMWPPTYNPHGKPHGNPTERYHKSAINPHGNPHWLSWLWLSYDFPMLHQLNAICRSLRSVRMSSRESEWSERSEYCVPIWSMVLVYMLTIGVYGWDPWSTIYISTVRIRHGVWLSIFLSPCHLDLDLENIIANCILCAGRCWKRMATVDRYQDVVFVKMIWQKIKTENYTQAASTMIQVTESGNPFHTQMHSLSRGGWLNTSYLPKK